MAYDREKRQVANTLKAAGYGATIKVEYVGGRHPTSGFPTKIESPDIYFTQVSYSNEDLANNSIAEGLVKILVASIDQNGQDIPNFAKIVSDKTGVVIFKDGTRMSIKNAQVTKADGVNPILGRLFLSS